jgi:hypothetical protein
MMIINDDDCRQPNNNRGGAYRAHAAEICIFGATIGAYVETSHAEYENREDKGLMYWLISEIFNNGIS